MTRVRAIAGVLIACGLVATAPHTVHLVSASAPDDSTSTTVPTSNPDDTTPDDTTPDDAGSDPGGTTGSSGTSDDVSVDVSVVLASQTWIVPGRGDARLRVDLDTTGIPEPQRRARRADRDTEPSVRIEIEVHEPISTRDRLDAFVAEAGATLPANGEPGTADDSNADTDTGTGTLADTIVDTVRVDLRDTKMKDGRITVRVVVEPEDDDTDELAMPQQGIHPIVIRVTRGDEVVARIPTFVDRLAWGTDEPRVDGITELAVTGRVDARPSLRPNGATVVEPSTVDELDRIRQVLDDLPGLPVALALRPEALDGLDRSSRVSDRALLGQLALALGERHVLSQPYVGMDPSAMVAAGLDEQYVDELRLGEDTIGDVFPRASSVRSVALVETPLTEAGADLLRDLGVRDVLLLGTANDGAANDGTSADATGVDHSLAREVALPSGGALLAHTVDPLIADRLLEGATDPAVFANHFLARTILWQREIVALGGVVDGRSLVLTTPDGSLPDGSALSALEPLVARDPRLRFAPLDAVLGRTDVRNEGGLPVQFATSTTPSSDLTDLAARLSVAASDVATTGSMLPRGDERLERWSDLLEIAPSSALDIAERNEYLDTVVGETAALRAAVVPPPETTFTLGGRSGDVSLSLRNDADVPLTVIVRMSSPKLLFPEGPATVELTPGATTIVRVPVEARSNNTFPVTVEVLTPWQLAPVSPPVQLTARVTAFTGLGQVVTGAGALILATWWVRHWRTNRRSRAASTGAIPSA